MSLSIGEVVAALREEFPDLRESKIRFLETEGLITPQRTASGYRRYTDEDLTLLRRVLRLQRDQFWPLRVIADHIRSGAPDEPVSSGGTPPARPTSRGQRIGRETLLARAHLAPQVLDQLQSFGLVAPDAAGRFTDDQVEVAVIAGRLIAFGVEPRHLRPARAAADREVGLLRQALTGMARAESAEAGDRAAELVELMVRLHAVLLWSGLGHGSPPSRG